MTGEQLFNLFVEHSTTATEIAKLNVGMLVSLIGEMRDEMDDDILMSDRQIAIAIQDYAKSA